MMQKHLERRAKEGEEMRFVEYASHKKRKGYNKTLLILVILIFHVLFLSVENLLSKLWWNMKTQKKLEENFKNTSKN